MKLAVPFSIPEVFQGLAETQGILSLDGPDLKLEFQTADSLVGVVKSGVREVRLPVEKVAEITFRQGWLRSSLHIRMSELKGIAEVPNSKDGEVVLSVAKKHSQAAMELVSRVQTAPPQGTAS